MERPIRIKLSVLRRQDFIMHVCSAQIRVVAGNLLLFQTCIIIIISGELGRIARKIYGQ